MSSRNHNANARGSGARNDPLTTLRDACRRSASAISNDFVAGIMTALLQYTLDHRAADPAHRDDYSRQGFAACWNAISA